MNILNGKRSYLEKKAVEIIEKEIVNILKKKRFVVFGIVGGTSVSGIFKLFLKSNINWRKVHVFMVDERLVSNNSKQSNFKLAKKTFLDKLLEKRKISSNNLHPFHYKKEITSYSNEIRKYGGRFDIVLLSSGEDCHVGALYPNHSSIENKNKYFIETNNSPKAPKNRMSSSKTLLMKSRVSILLFFGRKKKDAYLKFLNTNDIDECPASIVKKIKRSYVLSEMVEN